MPSPLVRFNEPHTFEREGDARIYITHLHVSCACFLQTHPNTLHSSLDLILITISWGFAVTGMVFHVQRCYNTDWSYTLKASRRSPANACWETFNVTQSSISEGTQTTTITMHPSHCIMVLYYNIDTIARHLYYNPWSRLLRSLLRMRAKVKMIFKGGARSRSPKR